MARESGEGEGRRGEGFQFYHSVGSVFEACDERGMGGAVKVGGKGDDGCCGGLTQEGTKAMEEEVEARGRVIAPGWGTKRGDSDTEGFAGLAGVLR